MVGSSRYSRHAGTKRMMDAFEAATLAAISVTIRVGSQGAGWNLAFPQTAESLLPA